MGPISILQGICERGCIFAFAVVGAYITSRVIRFDDLTLEGSFGLGGALAGLLMIHHMPVWLHLPIVIIAGMTAGLSTGLLHHYLGINALISGIVVMTGIFSINLKLAGAHLVIPRSATIFHAIGLDTGWHWLPLSICIISVIYAVRWLLSTECGLCLRAIGDNPHVITQNGHRARIWHIMRLMLANAITAVGGYLLVSHVGYFPYGLPSAFLSSLSPDLCSLNLSARNGQTSHS